MMYNELLYFWATGLSINIKLNYQMNNTEIEKLYFRFNQDILYISGFTELNIKQSIIDF